MRNALVVVDVQKDFVEGGSLAVAGGQLVADKLASVVLPIFQEIGALVLFTKDWHIDPGTHFSDNPDYLDSWPRHCVAGTEGAEFASDFGDVSDEIIFRKGQFEAAYSGNEGFNGTEDNKSGLNLDAALKYMEIDTVDVVGIAYDYCVKATALDLARLGFKVNVIKDFTASVHPDKDDETTFELEEAGVRVFDGRKIIGEERENG